MYWNPLPVIADNLKGVWEERNWRNTPGPFYGATTDNCWTGRLVAPQHVMYDDDHGREFIYRQPQNPEEVRRVLDAAIDDPWEGYAADGDDYWTPTSVREWWADRGRLREWAIKLADKWSISEVQEEVEAANGALDLVAYLDNGMEAYLRGYVFWLAEGREPFVGEPLPEL